MSRYYHLFQPISVEKLLALFESKGRGLNLNHGGKSPSMNDEKDHCGSLDIVKSKIILYPLYTLNNKEQTTRVLDTQAVILSGIY